MRPMHDFRIGDADANDDDAEEGRVRERDADAPEHRIALHVPMGRLLDGSAELARDGRYLIVCAHGVRSLALARHLRAQGYPAVYSLVGGLAGLEDLKGSDPSQVFLDGLQSRKT